MPTWCFKSATQYTRGASVPARDASVHGWYWQIDTQHALIAITSKRLFPTLEECISDARVHGFQGDVDLPEQAPAHPALIACEAGDYVHGIVQRSWREREQFGAA